MSKKTVEAFQPKITRNDRFAQMSHQEKVIEQKKREIQAKLDAKIKTTPTPEAKTPTKNNPPKEAIQKSKPVSKPEPKPKPQETKKNKSGFNAFSNDGSFLDQFRQMKDKPKHKAFKSKDRDRNFNTEERNMTNNNRWSNKHHSPSPLKDRPHKIRVSRFSDKIPSFEPNKITINTATFNSAVAPPTHHNFDLQQLVATQNATGQPLLKNLLTSVPLSFPSDPIITAPPVLLNVPPPQIITGQISTSTIVLNSAQQNVLVTAPTPTVLTTVTLPPPTILQTQSVVPSCISTVELSSIPPPNPIQVQNIPQPEPINALNIPPPAPIQVQNIPTPTSIQLNEIPNPKPIDLLTIPTPTDDSNKTITDPDFIKNIPPPNKSVPPPSLADPTTSSIVSISVQSVQSTQNVLIHAVPPPPPQMQTLQTINLPVTVVSTVGATSGAIPSLMAQPILPPPGMGMANVNVNCPPPMLTMPATFINQPPPQMPPMNIPPPTTTLSILNVPASQGGFKDLSAVFPPGSPDFEAMASLARMVAQCGFSIEEVVRQRKNQDPSHWFLFHKDSTAYHQYLQLVEQFRMEIENAKATKPNPDDIYEPEMCTDDYDYSPIDNDHSECKRKRKSRWGDKDTSIPPPSVILYPPPNELQNQMLPMQQPVMLSKVVRTDAALLHYALNTFGTTNLTEEDWKKAEDHYKINLLYQDMVKKREELERLKLSGKQKYAYDSDEDVDDSGTWEHKLREKEMFATQLWAQELTRQAEGKHHIGDFLPPDELKRFIEKSTAAKEGRQLNFTDYKEFKIKEDNIGFKMLQKLGWSEGQGLGSSGSGIIDPVNKADIRDHKQGLGLNQTEENEDEYESYRKRMMLAYRFRPNPLNNPRRPYY